MKSYDLIIKNAQIHTMDGDRKVYAKGIIGIEGEKITLMQHVLSMDLYIMPLILGAAIGLAGGELSFFLQMSFFACGIATILQAGFFMRAL